MRKTVKIFLGGFVLIILILSIFCLNYNYNFFNIYEKKEDRKVHCSIDDTILIFEDLTKNEDKYSTIFDNYTLGFCRKLHAEYGMVFSFYCYFSNKEFSLNDCSTKYRNEFEENSDWIKFNYHAYDEKEKLNEVDISSFVVNYENFLKKMELIVGISSFDTYTRLSYFDGSKEVCSYLRSKGVLGFYTSDYDEKSYYLDEDEMYVLSLNNYYYDECEDISFRKSTFRLDGRNDIFMDLFKIRDKNEIEIFTHEWLFNTGKSESIHKIRDLAKFVKYYGGKYIYF